MSERIKLLQVNVPDGESGILEKTHRFTFAYEHRASLNKQISLSMPVRLSSYSRWAIHPIFEQNIPEGFVRGIALISTLMVDELALKTFPFYWVRVPKISILVPMSLYQKLLACTALRPGRIWRYSFAY